MTCELSRILHVDDDDDIREVVSVALQMVGGFDLVQCASGREALDKVVEAKPDLILLDVMMPGMDGPETARALKANPETADIPIVFVTARGNDQSRGELLEAGGVDVIGKPFDPMTLSDQVRAVWDRRS
ncbi:response regulator [Mesobaculum littorinae]|uniref:Response regulator n=1 Tax=Mesobaculum littorinae TaxID=2486419 RepID=A0A438AIQ5_9RHOB|nr:response regulator [Mesobaculum littorinae]RVV98562.1 response regulator [Mesobaculum littorinae]